MSTSFSGSRSFQRGVSLAFGPQHPAAHGILRFNCMLRGETIRYLDSTFGLLHRGTEKLTEQRHLLQCLPYFDRFDYVANLQQEHAFCLAVEALSWKPQSLSFQVLALRTVFDEIGRILNHLLTLSATALDLGSMGPIFWAFEEREVLMGLLEQASGARMHTSLYRPFSLDLSGLTRLFYRELAFFLSRAVRSLAAAFCGLLNNRSLRTRLSMTGQLSNARISAYGVTGLIARSAGIFVDGRVRAVLPYGAYSALSLSSYLGRRGDNLDRFLLRVKETAESFSLLSQLLAVLQPLRQSDQPLSAELARVEVRRLYRPLSGASLWAPYSGVFFAARLSSTPWYTARVVSAGFLLSSVRSYWDRPARTQANSITSPSPVFPELHRSARFVSMEALISHFQEVSDGFALFPGVTYRSVESPKGEVGVFLVSTGSARPSRLKLRTPVSHNMHMLASSAVNTLLGDFVMTFCSFDIVLGEIDR